MAKTILVIDDSETILKTVQRMLLKAGFAVITPNANEN